MRIHHGYRSKILAGKHVVVALTDEFPNGERVVPPAPQEIGEGVLFNIHTYKTFILDS